MATERRTIVVETDLAGMHESHLDTAVGLFKQQLEDDGLTTTGEIGVKQATFVAGQHATFELEADVADTSTSEPATEPEPVAEAEPPKAKGVARVSENQEG